MNIKSPSPFRPAIRRPRGQRSAAIIAVLAVVVFLTVIVVSIAIAMRIERQEAHSYVGRSEADFMSREGVEDVKAALAIAQSTNAGATNSWATGPGVIEYWVPNAAASTNISLCSSIVTNGTGVFAPADLNAVSQTDDGQPVITGAMPGLGASTNMYLGWIYVYQDGTRSSSQTPVITANNPIIGRYAYWADDESGRISVNPPWGGVASPLTNAPALPHLYGLSNIFGGSSEAAIFSNSTNYPFNSVDQVRSMPSSVTFTNSAGFSAILGTNRYLLTAHNFSYNLNPFGQQKILLTTQAALTNGTGLTNYLNILGTLNANKDPGQLANINQTALSSTLYQINNYLNSTNWPGATNSFVVKFYGDYENNTTPPRTLQLALDMIEYVRSTESTNAIVEPISGTWNGINFTLEDPSNSSFKNNGFNSPQIFFGTARHPMLAQAAVLLNTSAAPPNNAEAVFALVQPAGYNGGASVTLSGQTILLQSDGKVAGVPTTTTYSLPTTTINSGSYKPLTVPFSYTGANPAGATNWNFRVLISDANGATWEVAPLDASKYLPLPVDKVTAFPATPPPSGYIQVVGVNNLLPNGAVYGDPRVNKAPIEWGTNTIFPAVGFGWASNPNVGTTSQAPTQDTTTVTGKNIYAGPANLTMPIATNVASIAELGRVVTGATAIFNNPNTTFSPWRTLRLEPDYALPSKYPLAGFPPDWYLLTLFVAPPYATNSAAYSPFPTSTTTTAGQININSSLAFTNNANVTRSMPISNLLQAAVQMGSKLTPSATLVSNITNMTLVASASGGTNYFPSSLSSNFYGMPEQLIEVQGIADGGKASEANLTGLIDMATTQGSAFRVYCIGQAIQQTATGTLIVQAQQYREAVICGYSAGVSGNSVLLWKTLPP